MPDHERQSQLPYELADGCAAERKNDLSMAVLRVDADVYVCQFLRIVFELTHGGTVVSPFLSIRQLMAKPWGLCCSDSKARATVARATGLELVKKVDTRRTIEGDLHSYQIHWPGVMALKLGRGAAAGLPAPAVLEQGVASIEQPPALLKQGGRARAQEGFPKGNHSSQEQEILPPSFLPSPSSETQRGEEGRREGVILGSLSGELRQIPELVEAWPTKIAALPASKLVYGPFTDLSVKDLTSIHVIRWFRQQLGLVRPLTGNSGAELLLVIAAGRNAVACPDVKFPRRLFESQIRNGHWTHAMRHVPAAARFLEQICEEFPEVLTHPTGSGPRVNPEVHHHGVEA